MEVSFKHSIYNKVQTKTGRIGIVTNLGVDGHGVSRLWVVYDDMNISNCWEFEKSCNSAPNANSKTTDVDFYFNLLDKVKTPLAEGVITALDIGESDKVSCFIENNIQGVANDWWPASALKLITE